MGADYRLHRVKVRYPDHRVHARNALCQGQRPIVDQQRDVRLWSGFLHPVKGLEYLIRAMDRVRQAYPGAQLALVGGWDSLALPGSEGEAYRDRLLSLISELGLDGAVRVTGYLPESDISGLLYAADVVALPCTYGISFKSGSLLAALSHARPIVATHASVPDALLRDGEHVLCVPARESEPLAEAILRLLNDAALRGRLAAAGARAAAPFNWPAIANRHLAIYADLLAP